MFEMPILPICYSIGVSLNKNNATKKGERAAAVVSIHKQRSPRTSIQRVQSAKR